MPLATFLNGSTPVQLRGLAWLALSDTGQIGAGSVIDNAGGGAITVWYYGGTVPCRVDPLAANEQITADRLNDRSTHVITVPANTAATTNSRFKVVGGQTFEITAVDSRTGELARFLEAVPVS